MILHLPTKLKRAFTLTELLIVIGILSILLAIVLVALNPARQFSQANNTQRRSDVNAILNAIHQFAADNKGALPTGITTTAAIIKTGGAEICGDLVTDYLAALPSDPTDGTTFSTCAAAYDSGYTVSKSSGNNRVTVSATFAELGETISITR